VHAVDGVNLAIQPGEIYGLVGPDGAGKTTTLRLLCGALRPTQGEVTIAGFPLAHRMNRRAPTSVTFHSVFRCTKN